jgi:PAS domain S-box-containing protein
VNRRLGGIIPNSLTAWVLAILLAIAALFVRLSLHSLLGPKAPYITFFLATAASAAIAGFWPGIATAIGGAVLARFVVPPGGWGHLIDPTDPFGVLRYLVAGSFVCGICEVLVSSRERALTAEQRLRESDRIYRAIGESIPFGIWISDAAGHPSYVSATVLTLTGMTLDAWIESGGYGAMHPDDANRVLPEWRQCVLEQTPWDAEVRFRGVDGEYHPVLVRGVPVRDDAGRLICWAGINLDIRRLKGAEAELQRQTEQLKRSNRDLEQFAFVASHDMQEPLRAVNIYTELLLKSMVDGRIDQLNQFAGYIREGVERIERLIRDLLHYSRVIHEETAVHPVDAGAAAREAINVDRTLIEQSGAQVVIEPLPMVLASDVHMTQMFRNLISNAIKYRRKDTLPFIRISAELRDGQAVFEVDDNGMGFEPEYAEKVFKLFTRLHGNQYAGSGLGLAICQRIVERYGGSIGVKSRLGEGSTFFFKLPVPHVNSSARDPRSAPERFVDQQERS